jgi:hypothetical protein
MYSVQSKLDHSRAVAPQIPQISYDVGRDYLLTPIPDKLFQGTFGLFHIPSISST